MNVCNAGNVERMTASRAGRRHPGWRLAGWLVVAGLVGGCSLPQAQPDATRYYLLNATGPVAATETHPCVVGLRTVEVPAYLRPTSFAVRSGANEIRYLDFTCWGEPLDQGLTRVLAQDLQGQAGVARVAVAPFRPDTPRKVDVAVRVTACEGTTAGGVRFAAAWRITEPGSGKTVAEGTYTAPDLHWNGKDYGQLAGRLSEAVAGLGRAVAAALPGGG